MWLQIVLKVQDEKWTAGTFYNKLTKFRVKVQASVFNCLFEFKTKCFSYFSILSSNSHENHLCLYWLRPPQRPTPVGHLPSVYLSPCAFLCCLVVDLVAFMVWSAWGWMHSGVCFPQSCMLEVDDAAAGKTVLHCFCSGRNAAIIFFTVKFSIKAGVK